MPLSGDPAPGLPPTPVTIERFDEIDSTSLHARRLVESGLLPEGQWRVIVSETQTAGRGRLGRAWASPRGGLWFTLVGPLGDRWTEKDSDRLGLEIGRVCEAAIARVLRRNESDRRVALKLPNDVLIDGKKVLGVLTEVIRRKRQRFILVGVGINANFGVGELPRELAGKATTLLEVVGADVELEALLGDLVDSVLRLVR